MPADRQTGIAFRLPVELHEQLQTLAAGGNVSITALVEGILCAYAKRGSKLQSDETVTLVLRPDPDLLREARETITVMIRAGAERLTDRSS